MLVANDGRPSEGYEGVAIFSAADGGVGRYEGTGSRSTRPPQGVGVVSKGW